MMRKKVSYTNVTRIPSQIPRQLAIDILHSHGEIIGLSPLVTGFEAIKAPRDAPSDEFYSTWYEIAEKIQFVPGIGKLGSGNIKFKGVFHDMPWGLQTHIYAPANVDMRNKWQICGNQPNEPAVTRELGIDAPSEGLYLREDIEIKCNITMVSFVKKETKAASKILVDRLIKKAELLDSGVLQGMFEDGKLKTVNPADRSHNAPNPNSPLLSPKLPYNMPMSPNRSPIQPNGHGQQQQNSYQPPHHASGQNNIVMELPGDYYHPQPSPTAQTHLAPDANQNRYSTNSSHSDGSPNPSDPSGRWSHASASSLGSRPSSYASEGLRSPGLEQKGFASELPTMTEEEMTQTNTQNQNQNQNQTEGQSQGEREQYPQDKKYRYNPQDYADLQAQQGGLGLHPAYTGQQHGQQGQQYGQQHQQGQYGQYGQQGGGFAAPPRYEQHGQQR
ncbi:hypothetical protein B0J11DRAFT_46742 [Dendryphion nanum]|uniref:DUF7053 domain-containing protein n=1 Tax=Dendryphion nanum TaxID=256645 RepID=A0A9P9EKM6_9PLEO|nr:hypothetical protein B0J11DRAFT_46742 [Dendryphion nanum]